MRRRSLVAVASLLLLAGIGPATAPAIAPPVDPGVAKLLAQLGDADPAVRDAAVETLMGLSRDDGLPKLLAAVRAAGPVSPQQAGSLREVVTQVFLAAEPYAVADPTIGANGNIELPPVITGQNWPQWTRSDCARARLGVQVIHRWPGFPARRVLRDGDQILGVFSDPNAEAARAPDLPTHSVADLVNAIRDCPSRPDLALSVLRDGRVRRVRCMMVPEPVPTIDRQGAEMTAFLIERQKKADDYWAATFGPLVDDSPEPADGPVAADRNGG